MFLIVQVKPGCALELEKVVKEVLGDEMIVEKPKDFINNLLEDKDIVDATKAYEVSKKTKDEAAWMAARHNLLMVLGESKLISYFSWMAHKFLDEAERVLAEMATDSSSYSSSSIDEAEQV